MDRGGGHGSHRRPFRARNSRFAEIVERLESASRDAETPQDDPEMEKGLLRDLVQAAIEAAR